MGLKIKQAIGTSNRGHLEEFYVRIENIILDRPQKILMVVVAAYTSSDDARIGSPIYDDLVRTNFSGVIGVEIIYNGEVMEYPVSLHTKIENFSGSLDLYKFAYALVKNEYGKIFGNENIFDEF